MKTQLFRCFLLGSGWALMMPALACAMDAQQAEHLVKAALCLNGESIETVLQQKISSLNRDLGWQVFAEDHHYIVERSVLVSKSMQLRYRWDLDENGTIQAESDRAKTLCDASSATS